MLKSLLLLGLFSVAALPLMAQDYPKVEFGGAYSYIRANVTATDYAVTPAVKASQSYDLQGGKGEAVFNPNSYIGLVAEFGGYDVTGLKSGTGASSTLFTYLFGPRLNFNKTGKVTPFAETLFGGAHTSTSGKVTTGSGNFLFNGTSNTWALAVGGGLDYKVANHISIRLFQADYLLTRFDTNIKANGNTSAASQNNFRVGAGIQFIF
jgi:opacity protein-like surface antigen